MKRINAPITVTTMAAKLRREGTMPKSNTDLKEPVDFHWEHRLCVVDHVITVWHENEEMWLDENDNLIRINESWVYRVQTDDGKILDLHCNHKGEWTLVWDMTEEF